MPEYFVIEMYRLLSPLFLLMYGMCHCVSLLVLSLVPQPTCCWKLDGDPFMFLGGFADPPPFIMYLKLGVCLKFQ